MESLEYRQALRASWQRRRRSLGAAAPSATTAQRTDAVRPGGREAGPYRRLRQRVFRKLLQDLERRGRSATEPDTEWVRRTLDSTLASSGSPRLSAAEKRRLEHAVLAEIRGTGPLQPLFADPTVSDILVNGPDEVWVDRFGRLEKTQIRFDDQKHLVRLLGRLVSTQGRHLDEASPSVDVRLNDGSRLHAIIPPVTPVPTVSIRLPRQIPFRLEELYEAGTLSREMGELLSLAVTRGLNIVISGGAASGKTTLLNVLSSFVPPGERIVTVEETAELRLEHPHVVQLEARLPNTEGKGEVTLRNLVRHTLRMRPDRVIVGEVRGAEVFDMLQAMNTGHDGSMTTVHANSPRDALRRLENLVQIGGFELPSAVIREQLAAAFDLLVHTARFPDGSRRITSIHEMRFGGERKGERAGLETLEVFRWDASAGTDGEHLPTAHTQALADRLALGGRVRDRETEPAGSARQPTTEVATPTSRPDQTDLAFEDA